MQFTFTTTLFGRTRVWIARIAAHGPGEPTYKDTFLVGTFDDWATARTFAKEGQRLIDAGHVFAPCRA